MLLVGVRVAVSTYSSAITTEYCTVQVVFHAVCVKQTLVSGTHLTMDAGNYTQELGGQINVADVCLRCIISCFSYVHKMVLLNIATFCSVYHKGELESLLPFSIILLVGQQDLF